MQRTWRQSLAVYLEPRVLKILFLGFSSGLPLPLLYWTLSAWLSEEGVTKTAIGLFSWVGIAYNIKFCWSPLVDAWQLPVLGRWLGRRRSWLLVSQVAVIACIFGLGSGDPSANLWNTALWSVLLAFASATQDIVIDAYRTESLKAEELGAGSANTTFGYRIAMTFVGGAGALLVADLAGWFVAYATMAGCMLLGVFTTFWIDEPPEPPGRSIDPKLPWVSQWLQRLRASWLEPLLEFLRRPHWLVILAFIALYKYGDALIGVMANPFYLEMGFSKTQVAWVTKSYGLVMTLLGAFWGGLMVARFGLWRALMVAGVLQAASNLIYVAQALVGPSVPMLTVTISVENLAGGLALTAFVAYLSYLCNRAYTATQFALLSSVMASARTLLASVGGWVADQTSWPIFFVFTTVAALPGLVLLAYMMANFPIDATLDRPAGSDTTK